MDGGRQAAETAACVDAYLDVCRNRRVSVGGVLVLECTDPLTVIDVPHSSPRTGHDLAPIRRTAGSTCSGYREAEITRSTSTTTPHADRFRPWSRRDDCLYLSQQFGNPPQAHADGRRAHDAFRVTLAQVAR
jgi:hypothetical protein